MRNFQEIVSWVESSDVYQHYATKCVVTQFAVINRDRHGTKEKVQLFADDFGLSYQEAEALYEARFGDLNPMFRNMKPEEVGKEHILPVLKYLREKQ